ncbi:MAG TPA: YlxR family protein [Caldilineae bacterium]|nr:YlxR family protein [Caldilineae bacterium]
MRRRHIPQRTCIACRKVQNKRDLIRIVRTPEGEVVIDPTGKRSGRGAYLCPSQECWQNVIASGGRRLAQALKVPIDAETLAMLEAYAKDLPPPASQDEQGAGANAPA